jgi:hypothetical protein
MQLSKKIIILALFLVLSCKKEEEYPKDYKEFVIYSANKLCSKILDCHQKVSRTLPEELKNQWNLESCTSEILKDLDLKIQSGTDELQNLSRSCYPKLIASSCEKFVLDLYREPNCLLLYEKSVSYSR